MRVELPTAFSISESFPCYDLIPHALALTKAYIFAKALHHLKSCTYFKGLLLLDTNKPVFL